MTVLIEAGFAYVEAYLTDPYGPEADGAWDDLMAAMSAFDPERYEEMLARV